MRSDDETAAGEGRARDRELEEDGRTEPLHA